MGVQGSMNASRKQARMKKKNAPEEYKYNNNGRNNNIMQKIKLKESYCFEEVPVGMMCIYPVSKQIESANSQLQKSVCVSMHHRKFHGQGNGTEPEK